MIDRKTESDIKSIKGFIEFWVKFHSIYNAIIAKDSISKEDEDKFLDTKSRIKEKYDELKKGPDFNYMPHGRLTDPVGDILSLNTIRFISEKNLKGVNDDWKDSYVFLNNILELLKEKKRRFEHLNPIGVFFKRMFEKIEVGG